MRSLPRRRVEVVEVDARARRVLARRHPELSGSDHIIVVAVAGDIGARVVASLERVADAINRDEQASFERLVEGLTEVVDVPRSEVVEEARHQAHIRARILRDFGALSATDLADVSGSTAENRSQLGYRWRREGRVFAVNYKGASWYLRFQFDDEGRPLPVIVDILRAFHGWDEWDIAAWFVRPNGMLDRQRPVDVLIKRPEAVTAAAKADGFRHGTRTPTMRGRDH